MTTSTNFIESYAAYLKGIVPLTKHMKIVCDASNGPTGNILPVLFKDTPIEATLINTNIDPDFKAHGPNPLYKEAWGDAQKKIAETGASLGVIFDADGDRAVFIDEKGNHVQSLHIALLLMEQENPPFVTDELLYNIFRTLGKESIPSKVGSFFIKEAMRAHEASVGAEYSGHYYFKDFFYTDGGIITLLKVIKKLSDLNITLSEFVASKTHHIMSEGQARYDKPWETVLTTIIKEYPETTPAENRDGVTYFKGTEWINIRTSNTEPLIRISVGSDSEEKNKKIIGDILAFLTAQDLIVS